MVDEQRCASELQALRQDAIAFVGGQVGRLAVLVNRGVGVSEICSCVLQKVLAIDVAQELIDCCRKHQQWSPLFEDVEARIALFQGDVDRADRSGLICSIIPAQLFNGLLKSARLGGMKKNLVNSW